MLGDVIGGMLEIVGDVLISSRPKSNWGVALLGIAFGGFVIAIVYFGFFHGAA